MTTRESDSDLIEAEAALAATGGSLRAQSMALLLAEMQALSGLFAGPALDRIDHRSPEEELRHEAETEAGFDNMPV